MREMDFNRVYFFGKSDLANVYQLVKAEVILERDYIFPIIDINDIMEIYAITKYIENEIFISSWSEKDINKYKSKIVEYRDGLIVFFSQLNDALIFKYLEDLIVGYHYQFWEIMVNYGYYKLIKKDK